MKKKILKESPLPESSPLPAKVIDFSEALKIILDGKKVTKVSWGNKDEYFFLKNGLITIHKPDGVDYNFIISDVDITGLDFVEL